jgi:hypothetical protein
MPVAARRDYVYSTCRIMVVFCAILKSTLHNTVREGAQKLKPPLEQVAVNFPNEHNKAGIYDARTKKIRKQGRMATLPANAVRQGTTDHQSRNIREGGNQNWASGDEDSTKKD